MSQLARYWNDEGADVTVLTGIPNHPTGIVPAQYRGFRKRIERHEGYKIVRTWLYATPNEGIAKKTLGHISFMFTSVLFGLMPAGRTDVVVVSSPTFFSLFSAWFIAKVRRAALVVEIRDLWPAIFVELGVLKNKQIIWVLERFEMFFYRSADHVVTVTDGFRDNLIGRGIRADKVTTITNGVDVEAFAPQAAEEASRQFLGAQPGQTLCLYLGAHGISQGLSSLVDAADLVGGDIHFAFVGDGADKARVRERVGSSGVTNVSMLGSVPYDRVPALVAAADICLVPLRDVPLFSTFIPSKIFEYLGAQRAVIGAVEGEPARILSAAGAIVVPPENAAAMAAAIRELADSPQRRADMAQAGRTYVLEHFDRRQLARRYLQLLEKVAG